MRNTELPYPHTMRPPRSVTKFLREMATGVEMSDHGDRLYGQIVTINKSGLETYNCDYGTGSNPIPLWGVFIGHNCVMWLNGMTNSYSRQTLNMMGKMPKPEFRDDGNGNAEPGRPGA